MRMIDFRARPNTDVYMKDISGPEHSHHWSFPPLPPVETLPKFIAALDRNNISLAVFTGRQVGTPDKLEHGFPNDYIAASVRQYPSRLIGFAGVDASTGKTAIKELERCVRELGLRGVSLAPDRARLTPDDRRMYPLYAKAAELAVPVVFTTGPFVGRWATPAAIDIVAEDFPEVTFVCSHGCWPWVNEFISLAYRHRNVYIEPSVYLFLPGAEPMIDAARNLIHDRVLYASAFPFMPLETIGRFVKLGFDQEVLQKITFDNAARILGISAIE